MTHSKLKTLKYALLGAVICGFQSQTALAQDYNPNAKLSDIIVSAYSHHPQLKSLRAQLLGTQENIVQANSALRRLSYKPAAPVMTKPQAQSPLKLSRIISPSCPPLRIWKFSLKVSRL